MNLYREEDILKIINEAKENSYNINTIEKLISQLPKTTDTEIIANDRYWIIKAVLKILGPEISFIELKRFLQIDKSVIEEKIKEKELIENRRKK